MPASDDRFALTGSELNAPPGARRAGRIDPTEQVEVSVLVRPRRALDELDARLNRPGVVPLSREAYAASFGADPADLARVEQWASQHHMQVLEANPARRTVRLTGTADAVASACGVELVQYRAADGTTFRSYVGPIRIPAELQDIVQAIFGLDSRPVARRLDGPGPG